MKYLIALVILCLPAYLIRFSVGGIPTTALEILIYAVFLIGLGKMGYSQWHRLKSPFYFTIGLILLGAIIGTYIAPDKIVALGQLKAFFIDPLLVFWLVLAYLDSKDINLILFSLTASSLFVSIHAIIQKILNHVSSDGRVIGIFGYNPNYMAFYLVPITVITLAYGLLLTANGAKNRLLSCILLLVSLINIVALYFSGSRGGLLALAGAAVFYLIIRYWDIIKARPLYKYTIFAFIVIAIIGAWFAFRPNFNLSPEAGKRTTSSNNVRYQIWQTTFELGKKHLVWGIGLGNYQNAFNELTKNRVNFPEYITPLALTPHNLFLMFWLSTGLIGLVGLIWLLISFFRIGLKIKDYRAPILLSAMAAIVSHGLIDTPYFKNDLSVLFWLIFALMILLNRDQKLNLMGEQ